MSQPSEREPLLSSYDDFNPRAAAPSTAAASSPSADPPQLRALKERYVRLFSEEVDRVRVALLAQFEADLAAAAVPGIDSKPAPAPAPAPPAAAAAQATMVAKEEGNDVLTVNVGGVVYTTTKKTLLSVPDTYFAALLSPAGGAEAKQSVFIDRDGANFSYILNYLRDKESLVLPRDEEIKKRLLVEARFYGLHGLARVINSSVFQDAMQPKLSVAAAANCVVAAAQAPAPAPIPAHANTPTAFVAAPLPTQALAQSGYVPAWDEEKKHREMTVYGMSVVRGGARNDDAVALGRPSFPQTGVHSFVLYIAKKPKRSCYYFGVAKSSFKEFGANLAAHRWAWVYDDAGAVTCSSIHMGTYDPVTTGSRLQITVDMEKQSLSFFLNGKKQTSVFIPRSDLVPVVSLYNPGAEVCFSLLS
jgi:hypothetical protein